MTRLFNVSQPQTLFQLFSKTLWRDPIGSETREQEVVKCLLPGFRTRHCTTPLGIKGGGTNTSVQGSDSLSAQFLLCALLIQQFDVCEGKMASFSFTLAFPLAVHIDFGHFHHVAHLRGRKTSYYGMDIMRGLGRGSERGHLRFFS